MSLCGRKGADTSDVLHAPALPPTLTGKGRLCLRVWSSSSLGGAGISSAPPRLQACCLPWPRWLGERTWTPSRCVGLLCSLHASILRLSWVSWERASLLVMKTHADLGTPGVWGLRRAGVLCLSSGTSAGSCLFVSAGCDA